MISFIVPWNDSKDEYRAKSFDLIRSHITSMPDSELIIGYDYEQSMNRSRARNNAFLQAKGEFLVILDADTWISKDALIEAVDLVKSKNTWVVPYQHYYNLTKEFTDKIFTFKNLSICEEEENLEFDFKLLSWAGALVLTREMYNDAGFYDERFKGWGWEDIAFRLKLDKTIGNHLRCGTHVCHLWHPRGNSDFNTEDEIRNRNLFNKDYVLRYGWSDERI